MKHLDELFPAWLDVSSAPWAGGGVRRVVREPPRPPEPGNQALVRGEGWLGGSEEHLGKFGSFVCDCLLKAQRGLCASRRCSVASAKSEVEMPPASRPCSSPAETDSGELWEENLIILSPLTIDLGTGPAGAFVWDACPAAFLSFGVDL